MLQERHFNEYKLPFADLCNCYISQHSISIMYHKMRQLCDFSTNDMDKTVRSISDSIGSYLLKEKYRKLL